MIPKKLKRVIYSILSIKGKLYSYCISPKYRRINIENHEKFRDAKYRLSVVVPIYNAEKTMRATIDSVLSQKTDFKFKVVLLDDLSSDGSVEIMESYKQQHPDKIVTVQNSKNLGLPDNYYKALMLLSDTEYFTMVDPDDVYVHDRKLQLQVDALDANMQCMYSTHKVIWKSPDGEKIIPDGIREGVHRKLFYCHTSSKLYRNTVLEFLDGKNPLLAADKLTAGIASYVGRNYYIDKAMTLYNYNGQGVWSKLSAEEQRRRSVIGRTVLHYYTKGCFCEGRVDGSIMKEPTIRTINPYKH